MKIEMFGLRLEIFSSKQM